jgi:GH35 family endo-1,4-beta-xylanase
LFRFGTEIGAQSILENDPTSLRLREELLKRFNTVTLGNELKWMNSDDFSSALGALPWIRAHHLALRGHTLVWGSFQYSPPNLAGRTPAELRTALHEHIREYVEKLGNDVYAWDVVNEAVWEHDFWDAVGWAEFPEAFKEARRLNPHVLLAYNDFVQHRDLEPQGYASWKARVQQLMDAKAPFDLLGDQCHVDPPLIPVARLLQRWDDMARLDRRLEITEFDVSTPDDKLQAAYVRDFLTAAFSEPAMDGVILWGFYEGRMWKPQGALFRQDWTPRPALAAFDDLVLRDWRTRARLVTDTSGHIAVPAFFGTYLVTLHTPNGDRSAEIEHTPDHLARVVFRLPGISRQP